VAYGIALAGKTGAKLYLAHILAPVPAVGFVFPDNPADMDAQCLAKAKHTLSDLLPPNREELHYELITKIGAVESELLGIVHDERIDLVIMGSRGRTGLRRWFLGSVTEHLLRKLPVPVLTVSHITPEHEADAGRLPAVERILFATDLGTGVENGLGASAQLAGYFNATLTVAHVMSRPPFGEVASALPPEYFFAEESQALDERLHTMTRPYSKDLSIHIAVLRGEPYQAILHFADQQEIDLIVLNLERKSFVERVLLGTTAEQVIRMAHMPVLSIPLDISVAGVNTSVA
jgi:nucleotide-binding universal stress UspA family protein